MQLQNLRAKQFSRLLSWEGRAGEGRAGEDKRQVRQAAAAKEQGTTVSKIRQTVASQFETSRRAH